MELLYPAVVKASYYSGPFILRPPLQPENYALNLEVLKQRDIYIKTYNNGVTNSWS